MPDARVDGTVITDMTVLLPVAERLGLPRLAHGLDSGLVRGCLLTMTSPART